MQNEKSTLLLRFAGPLQSWGSSSRFSTRMTEREPTKSAVIGLVASALGRRREDPIEDIVSMKFGVRVDQPGKLISDFHTAKTSDGRQAFVSNRHYIADAVFLVGLEGSSEMVESINFAVQNPVFPLFLGRRSCPPADSISLGVRTASLEAALTEEPWQARSWYRKKQAGFMGPLEEKTLELIIDAEPEDQEAFVKNDLPLSFDQTHRKYGRRSMVEKSTKVPIRPEDNITDHDAMEAF